jgi:hypothetical protein
MRPKIRCDGEFTVFLQKKKSSKLGLKSKMVIKAKLPRFQFQLLAGFGFACAFGDETGVFWNWNACRRALLAIELQNSSQSSCQNPHSNFQTAAVLSL